MLPFTHMRAIEKVLCCGSVCFSEMIFKIKFGMICSVGVKELSRRKAFTWSQQTEGAVSARLFSVIEISSTNVSTESSVMEVVNCCDLVVDAPRAIRVGCLLLQQKHSK